MRSNGFTMASLLAVLVAAVLATACAKCPVSKGNISPRLDCQEPVNLLPPPLPAAIVVRPPNRRVDEPRIPAPELPRRTSTGGMIFPNDRLQDSPEGQSQCLGRPDALYNGCAVTKSCFGFPAGCEDSRNCQALVTVRVVDGVFTFQAMKAQLSSSRARYVAVGLAPTEKMNAASVMECQLTDDGLDVELYMSWNEADKKSNRRIDDLSSLTLLDKSINDDTLCCEFTRVNRTKVLNEYEFFLDERPYHLLLASGSSATRDKVGYHNILRAGSSDKILLSQPSKLGVASAWLLRLHGALMVLAWLFCVPLGALTARYFKQAWSKGMLCGAALWFSYHRTLMFTALSLSGAGSLAALIHIKGWSESVGIHGILGATTVCLAVVQVLGSFFRPAPGHSRRPVFNFLHHSAGYAAQLFAVVVIYLSVGLSAAMVPQYLYYIISAWVVFFISMHALHTLSEVRPFYFLIVIFGLALSSIAILVVVVIAPGSS